jgi:hypothetical protein
MDYSGTLSRGWGITWRHKWLWLLALIPALGGLISFAFGAIQQRMMGFGIETTPEVIMSQMGNLMLLNCLSLLFSLGLALLTVVTRGGMVAGVAGVARGESYGFGRAFGAGWRKILPLLGMSILLFIAVFVFIVALALIIIIPITVGAFAGGSGQNEAFLGGMSVLGILGLCCLTVAIIVGSILVSMIYAFAVRGIMIRDLGVIDSLTHGWQVSRENLGAIILLALPFVVIYLVLGTLFAAVSLGSMISGMMEMMAGDPSGFTYPFSLMQNPFGWQFMILYAIYAVVVAVLTAWQSATFTLAYLQWTGRNGLKESAAPLAPAL